MHIEIEDIHPLCSKTPRGRKGFVHVYNNEPTGFFSIAQPRDTVLDNSR